MSSTAEADTVIVGSGVAGALVAEPVLAAGGTVIMIERGALVPWAKQIELGGWEADVPGAEHNHENDPAGDDWPWTYVYGVGGSSLRWRRLRIMWDCPPPMCIISSGAGRA